MLAGPAWEDHGMPSRRIAVCLEVTPKQTVASALDWPGCCRPGRDEGAALEALASYAGRYAPVAGRAGSASRPRSTWLIPILAPQPRP